MTGRPLRIYADTSVFGGVCDEEFQRPSQAFFSQVESGRFLLVISGVVRGELENAPERVKAVYREVLRKSEYVESGHDALRLRDAYLEAGIVSRRQGDDALHVALATVSGCAAIVSWNFRHIVHFQKIPLYNAISELNGYPPIAIYSPLEVIEHEDQDVRLREDET